MKTGNNEKENLRYFVYARKSSEREERQILSIESQLREIKEKFGDLEVVEVLQESASAFEPYKRSVFSEIMRRIKEGEANGIIAWHPNRLSRNPVDGGQIIYFLDLGYLKDLKFVAHPFDNSPEGKFMLSLALSQSKLDSEQKGLAVKRGNKTRFERGQTTTLLPPGYMVNKGWKEKEEMRAVKDLQRFPLIKKGIELLLTGNYT